jgi:hypothetical protein
MDLPNIVMLTRCDTGGKEPASIETLDRETAKTRIDRDWWENLPPTLQDLEDEPDHHWEWRMIVSRSQNKPYFRSKCVKTDDGNIQAAILFRVDALSAIEAGNRAVFVDRLATAPQNRDKLVNAPVFRGGGTGLLLYAVAQSYFLGFEGRVNLFPVANQDFYTRLGFQPTNVTTGEDVLFELPAASAIGLLAAKGLIDG